jgi:hypothetical protein
MRKGKGDDPDMIKARLAAVSSSVATVVCCLGARVFAMLLS